TLLKPRAASSAPGAPARIAWSANSVSPAPPPCSKPTPCSLASAPTTTSAFPAPQPTLRATSAPCLAASISPAASACAISAWSLLTTPSLWVRMPSRFRPCRRNAAMPARHVELSHQLDGTLRVYRGDALLLAQLLPLQEYAERRPAQRITAQKRKPKMPRIYNLSGRPALAAVT